MCVNKLGHPIQNPLSLLLLIVKELRTRDNTSDHDLTEYARYKRCKFIFRKDQDTSEACSLGISLTSVTNATVFSQRGLSMQFRSSTELLSLSPGSDLVSTITAFSIHNHDIRARRRPFA
jgi:hypothetical protein